MTKKKTHDVQPSVSEEWADGAVARQAGADAAWNDAIEAAAQLLAAKSAQCGHVQVAYYLMDEVRKLKR